MTDRTWLGLSLVVVLIALYVSHVMNGRKRREENPDDSSAKAATPDRILKEQQQHALYVIGDLHGDAHCARYWVEQTGLIQFGQGNSQVEDWVWIDESSSLLFMGDYVDKGTTSRQTVEFVKALTTRFPQHVHALLGNHEMELLRDRDQLQRWGDNADFFQLPYASVHPSEYLNFLENRDETDDLVVDALYNASLELYGVGSYRTIISPSVATERSIFKFMDPSMHQVVRERLTHYQETYLNAFSSGTDLGTWLEQRPLLHLHNDTMLFVHGGVSSEVANLMKYLGGDDVSTQNVVAKINSLLAKNAHQETLNMFLDETTIGNAIYEMLVYRGNLKVNEGSCQELTETIMPSLGISLVGVGHTPDANVRILCNGALLALDSALSRWFRNSGNEYCRGEKVQISSNGRFRCNKINPKCQGQTIRVTDNGNVEIVE